MGKVEEGREKMSYKLTDNSGAFLADLDAKAPRILKLIGEKWEKYAKKLCPVGTVESTGKKGYIGGTLRDSIEARVVTTAERHVLECGSNVEYAPYVELGTGPHFTPPPEWETFTSKKGKGVGRGYVKPRPYIAPALTGHVSEYKNIMESELQK